LYPNSKFEQDCACLTKKKVVSSGLLLELLEELLLDLKGKGTKGLEEVKEVEELLLEELLLDLKGKETSGFEEVEELLLKELEELLLERLEELLLERLEELLLERLEGLLSEELEELLLERLEELFISIELLCGPSVNNSGVSFGKFLIVSCILGYILVNLVDPVNPVNPVDSGCIPPICSLFCKFKYFFLYLLYFK
jgi:hypothetical protein